MNKAKLTHTLVTRSASALDDKFKTTKTLQEQMPVTNETHQQFINSYANSDTNNELLVCTDFGDRNLVRSFNQVTENKQTITNYISNIKNNTYQVGDEPSQQLLEKFVKHTYAQDRDVTERTLHILGDIANSTGELKQSVGHSLVQTLSGLGNVTPHQAYTWYYKKLSFPPFSSLSEDTKLRERVLIAREQGAASVAEARQAQEEILKKITKEVTENMNDSWLKVFSNPNLESFFNLIYANKLAVGGGAAISATAIGFYVLNHPKEFIEWYKFIGAEVSKTAGAIIPKKTYKSVALINKETAKDLKDIPTEVLLENLMNRIFLSFKQFFFKK